MNAAISFQIPNFMNLLRQLRSLPLHLMQKNWQSPRTRVPPNCSDNEETSFVRRHQNTCVPSFSGTNASLNRLVESDEMPLEPVCLLNIFIK